MTEQLFGLYVDGVLQEPLERNTRPDDGLKNHFSRYKVELGGENFVLLYLDPNSLVKFNSQLHKNNADRMDCTNDGYSTVIAEWSISDGDLFLGNTTLYGMWTEDCTLLNATLTVSPITDREKFKLSGIEVYSSTIINSMINGDIVISDSEITESAVECCLGGELLKARVENSSMYTAALMNILDATLFDCKIHTTVSDLFIANCTLEKVSIMAPRVSVESIFHTFELEFSNFSARFVRMIQGSYALCDKDGWMVTVDFDRSYRDFYRGVMDLVYAKYQPMPDSITKYIVDCVKSRIEVIETIEHTKDKIYGLLRLNAVE